MDFVLVKKRKGATLNLEQLSFYDDKYISGDKELAVYFKKNTQHSLKEDKGIFISGRIHKYGFSEQESVNTALTAITNKEWPLSSDYTGTFAGMAFNSTQVLVYNDPIGLYKLFYHITDDYIIVSTTLSNFKQFGDYKLTISMLALEVTAPEYSQYGKNTVLEGVKSLLPGEMVVLEHGKEAQHLYDVTIKQDDKTAGKNFSTEIIEFMTEEFRDYYKEREALTIPMSGGVDSRVILAPILNLNKKVKLSNYGRIEYLDSSLPKKIADKLNLEFEIYDPVPYSFPEKDMVWEIVERSDSLHVNSWIPYFIDWDENSEKETFLLGDMCDILRSKAISSLQSRDFRKKYYANKFFSRKKMELTPITAENKKAFQDRKRGIIVSNAKNVLSRFKTLPAPIEELIKEIEADVNELFTHMERYSPKYIESYEELYGIFTHGRKSMGKQINLLKYKYNAELPLLNIRMVRKILNYSPTERYSDELTNKMFKHKSWRVLGNFTTSQNPFFSYNSNYFLMIFGWFLRSGIDQTFTRWHLKSKGKFKRMRLFKTLNSKEVYNYEGAYKNFTSYLENELVDCELQKKIFRDRKTGEAWPLSSMDLIIYGQLMYYIDTFYKNNKKEENKELQATKL